MSYEGKRPADWTPAPLQAVHRIDHGTSAWIGQSSDEDRGRIVMLAFARPLTDDELLIVENTLIHHLPATLTGHSPPQEG